MRTDVLLSAASFWPREGGAERQMKHVLSRLTRSGLSCVVVTQVLPGQPRRTEVDGVRVVRVGSTRLLRRAPRLGNVVWALCQSLTILRLRPRATISLQLGVASAAVAVTAGVRRRRHVVRLTGGGTLTFPSEPWVRRSTLVGRLVVRVVARRQVLLVAPAQHLIDDFAEAFPRHRLAMRVVPNGVDAIEPTQLLAGTERHGVVWYARGGAVRSGQAFSAVAGACPDLDFVAIGHTSEVEPADNVASLGWVDDPVGVLGAARVLLNTSPTEGMPNTVVQALSAGMRVVGPPNQGLSELARAYPDRVTLVDVGDPVLTGEVLRRAHSGRLPEPVVVPSAAEVADTWQEILVGLAADDLPT